MYFKDLLYLHFTPTAQNHYKISNNMLSGTVFDLFIHSDFCPSSPFWSKIKTNKKIFEGQIKAQEKNVSWNIFLFVSTKSS